MHVRVCVLCLFVRINMRQAACELTDKKQSLHTHLAQARIE